MYPNTDTGDAHILQESQSSPLVRMKTAVVLDVGQSFEAQIHNLAGVTSCCLCLGSKVALEHTAESTVSSQLAHTFLTPGEQQFITRKLMLAV